MTPGGRRRAADRSVTKCGRAGGQRLPVAPCAVQHRRMRPHRRDDDVRAMPPGRLPRCDLGRTCVAHAATPDETPSPGDDRQLLRSYRVRGRSREPLTGHAYPCTVSTSVASDPAVRRRPLRRDEYELLVRDGALSGERVELVGGELVRMSPHGSPEPVDRHAAGRATDRGVGATMVRRGASAAGARRRQRARTGPRGDRARRPDVLPATAELVVEVAETSLSFDMVHKAPRYASADIAVCWVVDVGAGEVVVHRSPHAGRYRDVRRGPHRC